MEERREYEVVVLSASREGRLPLWLRTFGGRRGEPETRGDTFLTEGQAKKAIPYTVDAHRRRAEHNISNKGRIFFGKVDRVNGR